MRRLVAGASLAAALLLGVALPATAGVMTNPPTGLGSVADTPNVDEYSTPGSQVLLNSSGPNGAEVYPRMYLTDRLAARHIPIPTNRWFSSVVVRATDSTGSPSDPNSRYGHPNAAYGFPIATKIVDSGLFLDMPGKGSVVGGLNAFQIATFVEDMRIRLRYANGETFYAKAAYLDTWSDWFVEVEYREKNKNDTARLTYGQGTPYVYWDLPDSLHMLIDFPGQVDFYDSNGIALGQDSVLVDDQLRLQTSFENQTHWGFFGPPRCTFTITRLTGFSQMTIQFPSTDSHYLAIAGMTAAGDRATLYNHAYAWPTQSRVSWTYNPTTQQVSSQYAVTTSSRRLGQTNTLLGTLPHHRAMGAPTGILTYNTLRGQVSMLDANSFNTVSRVPQLLPFFPDSGTYVKANLRALIAQDRQRCDTDPQAYAMYVGGQQMAREACLIPIADQMGDTVSRDTLIVRVRAALTNWATYTPGENKGYYYYDTTFRGFIPYNETFQSWAYTDQHYALGYHLYAASILGLYDSSFVANYGSFYDLVVKHLFEATRTDADFPFMRYMNPYEGRSEAHGMSPFDDGNNQESSGESMNAIGSALMWTLIRNNNTTERDALAWAFATEYQAVRKYWFNIDNDVYDATFPKKLIGIVWGGKAEHVTFFGGSAVRVHGIQATPFFPTCLYLARESSYVEAQHNEMYSEDVFNDWQGVHWKWKATYNAQGACNDFDSGYFINEGQYQTYSQIYHHIHNFNALGYLADHVYANYPLAATFDTIGRRSFVAYNPNPTPLTVKFYDNGTLLGGMVVQPNSIHVEHSLSAVADTPVIGTVTAASDTGRFFDSAPIDTGPAGDTVWFGSETQTITLTVTVSPSNPDTLVVSGAFDTPATTDHSAPYQAVFTVKPQHAARDTFVTITVTDTALLSDSMLLWFRPDTTAPDTVASHDSPLSGSTVGPSPYFRWSLSNDSQSGVWYYRVQVSQTPTFATIAASETTAHPDTDLTLSATLTDTMWYWRVLAYDRVGTYATSGAVVDTFRVDSSDTPVITLLQFSSDTPLRFWDDAPFDTGAGGDTVWFAAETQVVTCTVAFATNNPDSLRVGAVFDSGIQYDTAAPYVAVFAIRPAHAAGETTVIVTVAETSAFRTDSLTIRFRPDTTAPETVALLSPPDSSTANGAITFRWNLGGDTGGSGIYRYQLQVSSSPNFDTITASAYVNHPESAATISNLADSTWYWRTLAYDRVGNVKTTGTQNNRFVIAPLATGVWYVNDTSTSGDVFASVVGASSNSGTSPLSPKRYLKEVAPGLKAGDTIHLDAGIYNESQTFSFDTGPVWLIGADSQATIIDFGDSSVASSRRLVATNQTRLTIRNLQIRNGNKGVHFLGVTNSTIENVTIYGAQDGIFLEASSSGVTARACELRHCTGGLSIVSANQDTFLGNTIVSPANIGIVLTSADTCVVDGNTITNDATSAIQVVAGSDSNLIRGNTITAPGTQGILLDSAWYATVESNTVTSAMNQGIELANLSHFATVRYNTALSSANAGIHIDHCDSAFLLRNTARNGSQAGFFVYNTRGPRLDSNIAYANGQAGFQIDSSPNAALRANEARGNTQSGIFVLNGSHYPSLTGNIAETNAIHGFIFNAVHDGIVLANLSRGNTNMGIRLENGIDSFFVEANRIDSNANWAISIDATAKVALRKNNIVPNPGTLLGFDNPASNIDFTRNYFGTIDSAQIRTYISGAGLGTTQYIPYRLSPVDTTTGADSVAPKAPDTVAAAPPAFGLGITVSWSPVSADEEADSFPVNASLFRIYRSKIPDTSVWIPVGTAAGSALTYADNAVTRGETYTYRVTTVDTGSTWPNESFFSDSQATAVAAGADTGVVINEILANPNTDWDGNGAVSTTQDEWVELYNTRDSGIGLASWKIGEVAAARAVLSDTIPARGYLLVYRRTSGASGGYFYDSNQAFVKNVIFSSGTFGSLNNPGDTVTLTNAAGETVDEVIYPSATTDNAYGRAWDGATVFKTVTRPTPGAETPSLPSTVRDSNANMRFRIDKPDTARLGESATLRVVAVDAAGDTVVGFSVGSVPIIAEGGPTINITLLNFASGVCSTTVKFLTTTGTATLSVQYAVTSRGVDTVVVEAVPVDTPTITLLQFSSDTPERFFDGAPFDTTDAGDTVWFGSETQGVTLTVLFGSTVRESISVGAVFDSGIQTDTSDSYQASFLIKPRHAFFETATVLTVFSSTGQTDTLTIRFKPDTVAPDTVTPIQPVLGETTGKTPTLRWVASADSQSGVAYYTIQVATSASFGQIVSTDSATHPDTDVIVSTPLSDSLYFWRVIAVDRVGNRTTAGLRADTFQVQTTPPSKWYVNDTSTAGDSFTSAIGDTANSGGSPGAPKRFVNQLRGLVHSGDTIYVDGGVFTETAAVSIDTGPLWIVGIDSATTIIDFLDSSPSSTKKVLVNTRLLVSFANLAIHNGVIGVHMIAAETCAVDRADLSRNGTGFIIEGASVGCAVTNSLVSGCTTGAQIINALRNRVALNRFTGARANGIELVGADNNLVESNAVSSGGAIGIFIGGASDSNTIRGNAIASHPSDGCQVNNADSNIVQGNSSTSDNIGFEVLGTSRDNRIRNNSAVSNTIQGFLASASRNTFDSNAALTSGAQGFLITGDTNTFVSNFTSGATAQGFLFRSSFHTIDANTAALSANSGFQFIGSRSDTIRWNLSRANAVHGFYIFNASSSNVLARNVADSNTQMGFMIESGSASNYFTGNLAKMQGQHGYLNQTSNGTLFEGNEASANTLFGFSVDSNSANVTLHKNNITSTTNWVNADTSNLDLRRNWWGSVDSGVIRARIAGGQLSSAVYIPFRLGAVDTTSGADTVAPKAPDTVAATNVTPGLANKVTWSSVTLDEESNPFAVGLDLFRIYRSRIPDTTLWVQVGTALAGSRSFTDAAVNAGETYYYRVTASDTSATLANQSFYSDSIAMVIAARGDTNVVINEVLPLPGTDWEGDGAGASASRDEWVELFNSSDTPVALASWKVGGSGASGVTLSDTIPTRGYLTVYRRTSGTAGGYFFDSSQVFVKNVIFGSGALGPLNNGGDTVTLLNGSGGVVDSVTYPSATTDSAYGRAWDGASVFKNMARPTPGAETPTLPASSRDSNANMRFRIDGPDTARLGDSVTLRVVAVDAAGDTVVGFTTDNVAIACTGGPTLNLATLSFASGVCSTSVRFQTTSGTATISVVYGFTSRGADTVVVTAAAADTPIIDLLQFTSDTPHRFFDGAPFDTGPAGDTVWFGAETQTITLIVLFTAQARDSMSVTAVFDSGTQTDTSDSYTAYFSIKPRHATGDTTATLTVSSTLGQTDTLLILFRVDTTAPETVTLISPHGETTGKQPTLSWTTQVDSQSGMSFYSIQIGSSPTFETVVYFDSTTHPDTDVAVTVPLPDTIYYWRVFAVDRVGNRAVAGLDVETFRVQSAPAKKWYVNDDAMMGDSFTSVVGDTANSGDRPDSPKRFLNNLEGLVRSGDTIYIDRGVFLENDTYTIDTGPLWIIGVDSTNTVIDFNDSSAASSRRIIAAFVNEISISNLQVRNAYRGIDFMGVDTGRIENVRTQRCGIGTLLELGADSNAAQNVQANGNAAWGIYVSGGVKNTVETCVAESNVFAGITVVSADSTSLLFNTVRFNAEEGVKFDGSDSGYVAGNIADSNRFAAFSLTNGSDNNRVVSNTISRGAGEGVYVTGSNRNTLDSNTATRTLMGVRLLAGATGNLIRYNRVESSTQDGYNLNASDSNILIGNLATQNTQAGYSLNAGSDSNTLLSNTSSWDTGHGFFNAQSDTNIYIGNAAVSPGYRGFEIQLSSFNRLETNTVSRTRNSNGITLTDTSFGNLVRFNRVDSALADGFQVTVNSDSNLIGWNLASLDVGAGYSIHNLSDRNLFVGNTSSDDTGQGFFVNASGNTFFQNTAWSPGAQGIFVQGSGNDFLKNTVLAGASSGFEVNGASACTLDSNRVTSCGAYGFFSVNNALADTFRWNIAESCTLKGYYADDSGLDTFIGNSSYRNLSDGFNILNNSNLNTLTSNTSLQDAGYGFIILTDTNTVIFNTATQPGFRGFGFQGANGNIIDSNTSTRAAFDYGFAITDSSYGNLVRYNRAESSASDGFQLTINADSNLIGWNVSSTNTGAGYSIHNYSDSNRFVGNLSQSDTGQGFYVNASNNLFELNTCTRPRQQGFFVIQGGNTFDSNAVLNSLNDGMALQASNTVIRRMWIQNATGAGLKIDDGDSNMLESSTVLASSFVGVWIINNSDTVFVRGNISRGNNEDGFQVSPNCDGLTMINNVAESNTQDGFQVSDSSLAPVLLRNTAYANLVAGFRIVNNETGAIVSENLADSNGGDGFITWSAADNVVLSNNRASRNRSVGYVTGFSRGVVFEANDADSNRSLGFYVDGTSMLTTIRKNNIYAITDTTGVYTDSAFMDMTRNWWGTTDTTKVRNFIQGTGSFTARYTPFRLGAVDTFAGADTVAPKSPDTAAASADTPTGSIIVSWKASSVDEEADPFAPTVTEYRVYRSKSADTNLWLLVGKVSAPVDTFLDAAVNKGETYYYRMTASDTGGARFINEGWYSDSVASAIAPQGLVRIMTISVTSSAPYHFWNGGGIDTDVPDTVYFNNTGAGASQSDTVTVTISNGDTVAFPQNFGEGPLADSTAPFALTYTIEAGLGDTVMVLVARDSLGGADTATVTFVRDVTPPDPVTLIVPQSDTTTADSTPYFLWTPANETQAGVRGYAIQVARDSAFATLVATSFETDTDYTAAPLADSTYYWRVIPYDTVSNADTSRATIFRFTVDSSTGDTPRITAFAIVSSDSTHFYDAAPITVGASPDTVFFNPTGSGANQTCTITVSITDVNDTLVAGSNVFTVVKGSDTGVNKDTYTLVYRIPQDSPSALITIVATDSTGLADTKAIYFQSDTTPPDTVTPSAPPRGTETSAAMLALSWSASADSGAGLYQYRVQIDTSGAFTLIALDTTVSSTSVTVKLPANDTYYWHVIALDRVANSSTSRADSFVVDTGAPTAARPQSPSNGLDTNATAITFTWTAGADTISGLNGYRLQISRDPLHATNVVDSSAGLANSTTVLLAANDTYYWRLLTIDDAGNIAISADSRFTIDTWPPDSFSLTLPVAGHETTATRLTFRWNASADTSPPVSYELVIDGVIGGFALVDTATSGSSLIITLPANDTYTWRIIARDALNNLRIEGDSRFAIDTLPPTLPTLDSPTGSVDTRSPVQLRWRASFDSIAGLDSYRIRIDTAGTFVAPVVDTFTTALTITAILNSDTYFWAVTALDRLGNAATAAIETFAVRNSPDSVGPDTFPLNAPSNGTETTAATITFRWGNAKDSSPPVTYRLLVDANLIAPFTIDTTITDTFVTVTLPANDTYLWRVIATDNKGNSTTVGDSRVAVDTAGPSPATLVSPVGGAIRTSPVPLDWNASSDSIAGLNRYRLQIDTAGSFAGTLAVDSSFTTPDTMLALASATYFWRVIAIDDIGNTTVVSADSFRIVGADTTGPILLDSSVSPTSVSNTGTTVVVFTVKVIDSSSVDSVVMNLLPIGQTETTSFTQVDSITWSCTVVFDSRAVGDTYNLVVRFFDAVLNSSTTTIRVIVMDTSSSFSIVLDSPILEVRAAGNEFSIISTYGDSYTSIRYEYRPVGGAWTLCTALLRPNPDTQAPFWGTYWDIADLPPGTYDVRAVGTDTAGRTDPNPAFIRVVVDNKDSTVHEYRDMTTMDHVRRQKFFPESSSVLMIADGGTMLSIPKGAVAESVWIKVTVLAKPLDTTPTSGGFRVPDSTAFRIFTREDGKRTFEKDITIELPYADTDELTDNVGTTSIPEAALGIYHWDEFLKTWVWEPTSKVDGRRNVVTATVRHFTIFAVLAGVPAAPNLGNVIVYPNPFVPYDGVAKNGTPFNAADPTSGIIFDSLPTTVTVEVYSAAGRLVATMSKSSIDGRYQWDARTDDGRELASGMYILVFKTPSGERSIRKVMIVR